MKDARANDGLDLMDNDELRTHLAGSGGKHLIAVAKEIERVEEVQKSFALTGTNLSYWFEREEILRQSVYDAV